MLEMQNVTVAYGDISVLENQSLILPSQAHIALTGPSGCGKTSLLNLVAGLIKPAAGIISLQTERVGYSFQEPRLLPWLTAAENVAAVLSDKKSAAQTACRWLELVGLSDAADKYPAELSGGMAQRVSLARTLAYGGDILLLDEPFKGLDGSRRAEMVALVREHAAGKTLLLATHDREEANALCDRVYVYENRQFVPEG